MIIATLAKYKQKERRKRWKIIQVLNGSWLKLFSFSLSEHNKNDKSTIKLNWTLINIQRGHSKWSHLLYKRTPQTYFIIMHMNFLFIFKMICVTVLCPLCCSNRLYYRILWFAFTDQIHQQIWQFFGFYIKKKCRCSKTFGVSIVIFHVPFQQHINKIRYNWRRCKRSVSFVNCYQCVLIVSRNHKNNNNYDRIHLSIYHKIVWLIAWRSQWRYT